MAHIWQISVVQFKEKIFLTGVILSGKPQVQTKPKKKNFRIVLGSYFKKPEINKRITIISGQNKHETSTDDHGGFSLEMNQEIATDFKIFADNEELKIAQSYPVIFNESGFGISLISDVDDTILVSYTASLWKRVNTLLFTSPGRRRPIGFTKSLIKAINEQDGRIYYVSKSESNLFGILSSFIQKHDLPSGVLFLTPYLRFSQLFNPKKGKDYKERIIRSIIDNSPNKKFILIGDDTQQDIAVYSRIAELYPTKIFKIYIRKTRKNLLGNKKEQMKKLLNLAVSVEYFSGKADPFKEIAFIENH
jgi:phosphatidate phosphatase APP1